MTDMALVRARCAELAALNSRRAALWAALDRIGAELRDVEERLAAFDEWIKAEDRAEQQRGSA